MNYKDYESALNAILKTRSIMRSEAFESKGQKKEEAITAINYLKETQNLLNNLYGGVYEDEC